MPVQTAIGLLSLLINDQLFDTLQDCFARIARIICTFTCIVAGPTQVGKTFWVKRLIQNAQKLIQPSPVSIFWCYTEWQPAYEDMENVEFCEGLPDLAKLKAGKDKPTLLVLDDLMDSMKKDNRLTQLFTRGAHHWNVSIIHICQALFFEGLRTARINAHYLVLMKSPSDKLIYPGNNKFFMESFEDATSVKHGYLLIDLHPTTDDNQRLLTDVFNGDYCTVYTKKR